jgi:hypothetical protein
LANAEHPPARSLRSVPRYYRRVVSEAWRETWAFAHGQGLPVGVFVSLLGVVGHLVLESSGGSARSQVVTWLLYVFGPVGALMFVLFCFHLVVGPARIDAALRAHVERLDRELSASYAPLSFKEQLRAGLKRGMKIEQKMRKHIEKRKGAVEDDHFGDVTFWNEMKELIFQYRPEHVEQFDYIESLAAYDFGETKLESAVYYVSRVNGLLGDVLKKMERAEEDE